MPNSGNVPYQAAPDLTGLDDVGAIRERMRSFQTELHTSTTGFNTRLNELSNSVNGSLNDIRNSINSLASKFEDRGRAPWTLLIAGGGFFMTVFAVVGGLAYAPINAGLSRTELAIDKLADVAVGQREFHTYIDNATARRDDAQRFTFDRLGRLEDTLKSTSQSIVPRAEHEEQWKAQSGTDANLQRQIDELRRSFADVYSPRDEISRLERKVDELEAFKNK